MFTWCMSHVRSWKYLMNFALRIIAMELPCPIHVYCCFSSPLLDSVRKKATSWSIMFRFARCYSPFPESVPWLVPA
jgi:hypothetical protein